MSQSSVCRMGTKESIPHRSNGNAPRGLFRRSSNRNDRAKPDARTEPAPGVEAPGRDFMSRAWKAELRIGFLSWLRRQLTFAQLGPARAFGLQKMLDPRAFETRFRVDMKHPWLLRRAWIRNQGNPA